MAGIALKQVRAASMDESRWETDRKATHMLMWGGSTGTTLTGSASGHQSSRTSSHHRPVMPGEDTCRP